MKVVLVLFITAFFSFLTLGLARMGADGDDLVSCTSPPSPELSSFATWVFVLVCAMLPLLIYGSAYELILWLFPSMGGQ